MYRCRLGGERADALVAELAALQYGQCRAAGPATYDDRITFRKALARRRRASAVPALRVVGASGHLPSAPI
ncbi:MAG: hypothetical protein ACRDQA_18575 [Nocardioidaceae bacterium]